MKNLAFVLIVVFLLQSCVVRPRLVAHHKNIVYVKAPKHHKVVYVKGKKYHYWNGKHYRRTKKGYVIVRVR